MSRHIYLVALGSNQRVTRMGNPRAVIAAAIVRLGNLPGKVLAASRIIDSTPVGPSLRRYANAAVLLTTDMEPEQLLQGLQDIEVEFGRVRRGQRWRSRPLDLDIVLWSEGIFASETLAIPHPLFRQRDFVLGPAAAIAPRWRDPLTGLVLRQLYVRLTNRPPPARAR